MLLRFFRFNDPYRLLGAFLILILLSLPYFIDPAFITLVDLKSMILGEVVFDKLLYAEIYDNTPPASAVAFGLVDLIFGRSMLARQIISTCIIFYQAAQFSILLVNRKVYEESTYLPSLIFIGLVWISFDMFSFSTTLIASTFLLEALKRLFKEIEFLQHNENSTLDIGLYLGLASVSVLSYSVFLFGAFALLFFQSRMDLRRSLLLFFGFALPHVLIVTFYFAKGEVSLFLHHFYASSFSFLDSPLINETTFLILITIPAIFLLLSFITLNRRARFTKYQSQLLQLMYGWLFLGIIQMGLAQELTPQNFIVVIPPLTYLISHYFLLLRRKGLAEFMLWFFLLGIYTVGLTSRYGFWQQVDYSQMRIVQSPSQPYVQNSKILILSEDHQDLFLNNQMASYFYRWKFSSEIFQHPEYYQHSITISESFKKDPPDVIIDPDHLMENVLYRIPALQTQYQPEGMLYRRVNN